MYVSIFTGKLITLKKQQSTNTFYITLFFIFIFYLYME